jgi:hypothetical protein
MQVQSLLDLRLYRCRIRRLSLRLWGRDERLLAPDDGLLEARLKRCREPQRLRWALVVS